MKKNPLHDRRARTGSNLRRNPLPAHRATLLVRETRFLQKQIHEYHRACYALFSKSERRRAVDLIADARREWHTGQLKVRNDPARSRQLQATHRRKLFRLLARALPNFRKWQALTNDLMKEQRKFGKLSFANAAHISFGEVAPSGPEDMQVFQPPYPIYDQSPTDDQNPPIEIEDTSVVIPDNGHMMNRFVFDHDPDFGWIIDGLYQLARMLFATPSVACGVNFTPPRSGQLHLNATLQNFVNHVAWSVVDKFGFSSGTLSIQQRLFFKVVRLNRSVSYLPTTLLRRGIVNSFGQDFSDVLAVLDNSRPYALDAVTAETFPAFESVQIFVGSEVNIGSKMNDMKSRVDAEVWWQLKQLTVNVV